MCTEINYSFSSGAISIIVKASPRILLEMFAKKENGEDFMRVLFVALGLILCASTFAIAQDPGECKGKASGIYLEPNKRMYYGQCCIEKHTNDSTAYVKFPHMFSPGTEPVVVITQVSGRNSFRGFITKADDTHFSVKYEEKDFHCLNWMAIGERHKSDG
jgi:hypothetical protein